MTILPLQTHHHHESGNEEQESDTDSLVLDGESDIESLPEEEVVDSGTHEFHPAPTRDEFCVQGT